MWKKNEELISETRNLHEKDKITKYFEDQGFNPSTIEIKSEYVIVESDMAFNKKEILNDINGDTKYYENHKESFLKEMFGESYYVPTDVIENRQRGILESNSDDAVKKNNVALIHYLIRPSLGDDCGDDWETALDEAVNEWNDLEHCRVFLTSTDKLNKADIIIGSDLDLIMPDNFQNLSGTALANIARSGNVGKYISINDSAFDWSAKKKTMKHEIGHTLGFYHPTCDPDKPCLSSIIHGTSVDGIDNLGSLSLMTQGSDVPSDFNIGDLRAARIFYPESLEDPTDISVTQIGSNSVSIRMRNNEIDNPYYWLEGVHFKDIIDASTATYIEHEIPCFSDNEFVEFCVSDLEPNSSYTFYFRGCNFRKDIRTKIVNTVEITLL